MQAEFQTSDSESEEQTWIYDNDYDMTNANGHVSESGRNNDPGRVIFGRGADQRNNANDLSENDVTMIHIDNNITQDPPQFGLESQISSIRNESTNDPPSSIGFFNRTFAWFPRVLFGRGADQRNNANDLSESDDTTWQIDYNITQDPPLFGLESQISSIRNERTNDPPPAIGFFNRFLAWFPRVLFGRGADHRNNAIPLIQGDLRSQISDIDYDRTNYPDPANRFLTWLPRVLLATGAFAVTGTIGAFVYRYGGAFVYRFVGAFVYRFGGAFVYRAREAIAVFVYRAVGVGLSCQ